MVETSVTINVGQVRDKESLHTILKETLGFPDFYGKNWDAFWDAITGLVVLPKIIIFERWEVLEANLFRDAECLKKLLKECNGKHPRCEVNVIYH